MTDRRQYENELISDIHRLFAGIPARERGISDADVGNEWEAARRFYAALEIFRAEVKVCAEMSPIQHDQFGELLMVMEDYTPDQTAWEEKVSDAQRGY